eukprot:1671763-Rhodomonas_salina.2
MVAAPVCVPASMRTMPPFLLTAPLFMPTMPLFRVTMPPCMLTTLTHSPPPRAGPATGMPMIRTRVTLLKTGHVPILVRICTDHVPPLSQAALHPPPPPRRTRPRDANAQQRCYVMRCVVRAVGLALASAMCNVQR